MTMNYRVVFMGSPDFALPTLQALAKNYHLTGVVTQPDRPAGRGRKMTPPPVKVLAQELDLPVIQPPRVREPEAMAQIREWRPDVIVVAAFGQILKTDLLELPPHGCVNVHASLLPRWRGAAPINAAILHGDSQTGITIMKMDPGMDTGPIISTQAIPIEPDDTAGSLSVKLAQLGADLLVETLPTYLSGELQPQPQPEDETLITYAPRIQKAEGELDFSESAETLSRRVRAFQPWPGTFTRWKEQRLKIHRAQAVDTPSPGTGIRTIFEGRPAIGAAEGLFVLDEVQPSGKKSMPGEVFLRGARDWE
jgi:methionyl-tRNA formyltransferase